MLQVETEGEMYTALGDIPTTAIQLLVYVLCILSI